MYLDLRLICRDLLDNSAPDLRMRGQPGFSSWAEALATWADNKELAPFRAVLQALADNALTDLGPIESFLAGHNPTNFREEQERWKFEDFFKAAAFADRNVGENRYAAFIVALVVTLAWIRRCGEFLYDQSVGVPNPGWHRIVPVLARTSLKAGAIPQARLIVRDAYECFLTAFTKMRDPMQILMPLQRLAWQIEERYDSRLRFFAEQLRDSCRAQQPSFRPEMGAILWSLGLVPESLLFHANVRVPSVPSLTFCKRVIVQSLASIPHDPLVQYVWLQLKDREPFNLRDHHDFFGLINRRYRSWMLDEYWMPIPPSEYYARTLIAWFRGTLTKEEAHDYIASYKQEWRSPGAIPGFIEVRLSTLSMVLAEQFDLFAVEVTPEAMGEEWSRHLRFAMETRRKAELNTKILDHASSLMGPLFYRIKSVYNPTGALLGAVPIGDDLRSKIRALEEYRASAMAYWLDVVPPLPAEHEKAVAELLAEEEHLLVGLRGAYFLIIYDDQLPQTFRRYGYDLGAERIAGSQSDNGRKEYEQVKTALQALWERMAAIAPNYAAARRSPVADLDVLLAAMLVPAKKVQN